MKTSKVILISAITSIVVMGLFVLLIHTMDGCWNSCKNDNDANYHGKDYYHADKEGCKEAHKKECCGHNNIWEDLKEDRIAFDSELSDEEKEIIANLKSEYCNEKHGEDKKCCDGEAECSDECKKACESLDLIVANHQESIDAIMAEIHENMHKNVDSDDDEEDEDEDDEMCEKKIEQHKKMFVRHFLLMDF